MAQGRGGTAATVLVVEDDPSLRLLCTVNLELEGHRVLEAPTIDAARAHLEREDIDVVLLDVHVGPHSGYDLIDPIRGRGAAQIVLMTGTAEVTQADRERVDAVLSKPFEPEDLAILVTRSSQASATG
jgi:two-component system, NtrC family, response regulator PilR